MKIRELLSDESKCKKAVKWEYRVANLNAYTGVLNEAGLLGWELVCVHGALAYFKKPLLGKPIKRKKK